MYACGYAVMCDHLTERADSHSAVYMSFIKKTYNYVTCTTIISDYLRSSCLYVNVTRTFLVRPCLDRAVTVWCTANERWGQSAVNRRVASDNIHKLHKSLLSTIPKM